MRRLLVVIFLFVLTSCSTSTSIISTVGFSSDVDMSTYENMNSINHNFRLTKPSEIVKAIENKGSSIFYLSSPSCDYCQVATELVNEAANNLNVTVYYIDTTSDIYPFSEYQNDIYNILYEFLSLDENGNRQLYTPHLFTIENGKVTNSHVGLTDTVWENSDKQREDLVNTYMDVMEHFISE